MLQFAAEHAQLCFYLGVFNTFPCVMRAILALLLPYCVCFFSVGWLFTESPYVLVGSVGLLAIAIAICVPTGTVGDNHLFAFMCPAVDPMRDRLLPCLPLVLGTRFLSYFIGSKTSMRLFRFFHECFALCTNLLVSVGVDSSHQSLVSDLT